MRFAATLGFVALILGATGPDVSLQNFGDALGDSRTSCKASLAPASSNLETLPPTPEFQRYVRELESFAACRELALSAPQHSKDNIQLADFAPSSIAEKVFADTVMRWNGDIFWAPASQSGEAVTRSGDEARAVFGPIPVGDCGGPHARIVPREVDGNIVELRPNPAKSGRPLEFEHRDEAGNVVKWTATLPHCDKPSLAGSSTYCGLNSRVARVVRGNVEWLFFCRKSTSSQEVSTDPYWLKSDPRFSLFGTIGFNRTSGEIVFFDGRKDRRGFDWLQPFVPPGGRSYADASGRAEAEALYDQTFQISCHSCHDNKNPYVVDPHVAQGRVGYFPLAMDPRAVAFSLGDFLPQRPRSPCPRFRVVGSAYTSTMQGRALAGQGGARSNGQLHGLPHSHDPNHRSAFRSGCGGTRALDFQSQLGPVPRARRKNQIRGKSLLTAPTGP